MRPTFAAYFIVVSQTDRTEQGLKRSAGFAKLQSYCAAYNGNFAFEPFQKLLACEVTMSASTPTGGAAAPLDKAARLREAALQYHEFPQPGKVAIAATKQMVTQYDLALAYSPGVAAPCEEIQKDPSAAYKYTSKGNLVAVITNGTAVLATSLLTGCTTSGGVS